MKLQTFNSHFPLFCLLVGSQYLRRYLLLDKTMFRPNFHLISNGNEIKRNVMKCNVMKCNAMK